MKERRSALSTIGRIGAALGMVFALALTGCATNEPTQNSSAEEVAALEEESEAEPGETLLTSDDVLEAFEAADLLADDPREVTATHCKDLGCEQWIKTEQVNVLVYATAAEAKRATEHTLTPEHIAAVHNITILVSDVYRLPDNSLETVEPAPYIAVLETLAP